MPMFFRWLQRPNQAYVRYSLKYGDYIWGIVGLIKGDAMSLHYSSP